VITRRFAARKGHRVGVQPLPRLKIGMLAFGQMPPSFARRVASALPLVVGAGCRGAEEAATRSASSPVDVTATDIVATIDVRPAAPTARRGDTT
jgi:hypothetical protein